MDKPRRFKRKTHRSMNSALRVHTETSISVKGSFQTSCNSLYLELERLGSISAIFTVSRCCLKKLGSFQLKHPSPGKHETKYFAGNYVWHSIVISVFSLQSDFFIFLVTLCLFVSVTMSTTTIERSRATIQMLRRIVQELHTNGVRQSRPVSLSFRDQSIYSSSVSCVSIIQVNISRNLVAVVGHIVFCRSNFDLPSQNNDWLRRIWHT